MQGAYHQIYRGESQLMSDYASQLSDGCRKKSTPAVQKQMMDKFINIVTNSLNQELKIIVLFRKKKNSVNDDKFWR